MANRFFSRVRGLYKSFMAKNVITLAASVSFFGFLSLFPFLVLVVSLASIFYERAQALNLMNRLLQSFPQGVEETVMRVLSRAVNSGQIASIISFLVLVYSSFAVFGQLRYAVNRVMGQQKPKKGWIATLESFAFFLLIAVAALLLMLGGSALFVLARTLERLTLIRSLWVIETGVFAAQVALCALTYRFLASERLPWKRVFAGGVFAAVLWEISKVLFGLYVSSVQSIASVYGFIGSLFFLMLWMFYAVLIYLAGAHISVEVA